MKYYLIAGEASGDLHASNVMKHLKELDPKAKFRFWGGDKMQAQGGFLVKHYRDLAFMGFLEVLKNLKTILNYLKFCKNDLKTHQPDVLILVDYPGFNLRLVKFAQSLGIKVVYYISPQLWAWKESRVELVKKYVDKMIVILPFELDFYAKHGVEANYVGHPLLDAVDDLTPIKPEEFQKKHRLSDKKIIALLPGSRKQEVRKTLKTMLSVAPYFPNYQFVIAGAPSLEKNFYKEFVGENTHFVTNETYDLLRCSHAALVTSGTATLETALLKVPQVVCYKTSAVSYRIARWVVKNIKYISLVNLIADKEIVKELIQKDFNTHELTQELHKILEEQHRQYILNSYTDLIKLLGNKGASEKAANEILRLF